MAPDEGGRLEAAHPGQFQDCRRNDGKDWERTRNESADFPSFASFPSLQAYFLIICPLISPPGKSPGPVFVGATPSFVWTFTYVLPAAISASRAANG
jgi:hypothetical protein